MPDWKRYVRSRLRLDTVKPGRVTDLVEDLAAQLQDLYEEALARGADEADAAAWARAQIADWERFASDIAAAERRHAQSRLDRWTEGATAGAAGSSRTARLLAGLWGDLLHAGRLLVKSPAFSAVAVLTLALGIGANTAIFSLVHGVLLQPLPFEHEDRLVRLYSTLPKRGFDNINMSYPDLSDVAAASHLLEGLSAFSVTTMNVAGGDQPERLEVGYVAPGFFEILRLRPVAGRTIDRSDQERADDRVALLAERLWRRRFDADPSVLGREVRLDGRPYVVAGIVPDVADLPEAWIPLPRSATVMRRTNRFLAAVGRLRPEASLPALTTELEGLAANLERAHPDTNDGYGLNAERLRTALVGDGAVVLLMLQSVAGLVLVIACANVANLLVARASARRQEMAIRAALGAGRARLVRQLLVESLLVAGLGGAIAVLIAYWGADAIVASLPSGVVRPGTAGLDVGVLLFTLGVSVATGVLVGVAPALQVRRGSLREPLQQGQFAVAGGGGTRLRGTLAVVQVAAALVLLSGAMIFLRGFAALVRADPGYDPDHVLTVPITLPGVRYSTDRAVIDFHRRLADRIRRIPGVEAAALTSMTFTSRNRLMRGYIRDGDPVPDRDETPTALFYRTDPAFLRAMRVPLRDGRYFADEDDERGPKVAIVSESLAHQLWPGQRAVGRRIRVHTDEDFAREVVGVVADVSQGRPSSRTLPQIYVPDAQSVWLNATLVIRDSRDANRLRAPVPRAVWDLDPDLPVTDMQTVRDQLDDLMATMRVPTMLLVLFGSVALLMAALGIYGVVSFVVVQRTREFGVRRALGAQTQDIARLALRQAALLTIIGAAIGLGLASVLGRLIAASLSGVAALDLPLIAAVASVAAGAAGLACLAPIRRAVRIDPLVALRAE